MKHWQKYAAEVLGMFVFMFLGYVSVLAIVLRSAGDEVAIAFGFGLGLLAALYAFGEISGGHFNPIVSLAMFCDRRLSFADLIRYWIAQFAGAILAALAVLVAFTSSDDVGKTATFPAGGEDWRAFALEVIASALFMAVILQVTKSDAYGRTALVAIPLTLVTIHLALIPFSGASVNPARSLASTLVGNSHWSTIWIYLIAPPIGAILGWIAHTIAVKGDTNLRDDFERMRGEMSGGPPASA
jgi:aquaporin Z